jgi:hypothetical protein
VRVVDHAGNVLKPGRLLRWQPSGQVDLYVKVKEVVGPTKTAEGRVEVVLTMAIAPQSREEGAIQFKDFITVMDPEDELRAEKVLDEVGVTL